MPTQLTGEFRAGYSSNAETLVQSDFLDAWAGNKLGAASAADIDPNTGQPGQHVGFNTQATQCLTCHNPGSTGNFKAPDFNVLSIGDKYTDGGYSIGEYDDEANKEDWIEGGRRIAPSDRIKSKSGKYLADDHPIGVEYPKEFGTNVDYREPDIKGSKIAFFDTNGNAHADPDEIRLYDTGEGYEVECGSCHDPHGIKVKTDNQNELIPSFLRMGSFIATGDINGTGSGLTVGLSSNTGSSLCLTCHVK
jgi:hypothetical protein